jgi:hypothetical protein
MEKGPAASAWRPHIHPCPTHGLPHGTAGRKERIITGVGKKAPRMQCNACRPEDPVQGSSRVSVHH